MERKEIAAFLVGCEASEFMAYADLGDLGCVVIGPDGKKYRFDVDHLAKAEVKAKPPPTKKAPTKRVTKSQATTKKKAASKK